MNSFKPQLPKFLTEFETLKSNINIEPTPVKNTEVWIAPKIENDADYLEYLRKASQDSSSEMIHVKKDGKWVLHSREYVSQYMDLLSSTEKSLKGLKSSLGRYRRCSRKYWEIKDKIKTLEGSVKTLKRWATNISEIKFDSEYGFKFGEKTYTINRCKITTIEAPKAYVRYKDRIEEEEKTFQEKADAILKGLQSNVKAVGWTGVEMLKERITAIYQEARSGLGAASREFGADYRGNREWKQFDKKRGVLSKETLEDIKSARDNYLAQIDQIAYNSLVSDTEKAAIKRKAEEKELKGKLKADRFWDRNYDKVVDDLKEKYEKTLERSDSLRGSALEAYKQDAFDNYKDAIRKVNYLEKYSKSSSDFDEYYYGEYREGRKELDWAWKNSEPLNEATKLMDLIDATLEEGSVNISSRLNSLRETLNAMETNVSENDRTWFRENLYDPWNTTFKKKLNTNLENLQKEYEEKQKEYERKTQEFLEYQTQQGRLATQNLIRAIEQKNMSDTFGWDSYDLSNPQGSCVYIPYVEKPQEAEEPISLYGLIKQNPLYPELMLSQNRYETMKVIDDWKGGNLVDRVLNPLEGIVTDIGEGAWNIIHDLGESAYNLVDENSIMPIYYGDPIQNQILGSLKTKSAAGYLYDKSEVLILRGVDDLKGLYDIVKQPLRAMDIISTATTLSYVEYTAREHSDEVVPFLSEIPGLISDNINERIELQKDFQENYEELAYKWSKVFEEEMSEGKDPLQIIIDNPEFAKEAAEVSLSHQGVTKGDINFFLNALGLREDYEENRFDDMTVKLAADVVTLQAIGKLANAIRGSEFVENIMYRLKPMEVTFKADMPVNTIIFKEEGIWIHPENKLASHLDDIVKTGPRDKELIAQTFKQLDNSALKGDVVIFKDDKIIYGSKTMSGKPNHFEQSWQDNVKISGKLTGVNEEEIYMVSANDITNYTKNKVRRVEIIFGIDYKDDFRKAIKTLEEVAASQEKVLQKIEKTIRVKGNSRKETNGIASFQPDHGLFTSHSGCFYDCCQQ